MLIYVYLKAVEIIYKQNKCKKKGYSINKFYQIACFFIIIECFYSGFVGLTGGTGGGGVAGGS